MDVLVAYRRDMDRVPDPMTREQEQTASPHQLVTANLAFAYRIAQQYQRCGIPFEDVIQLANLGLVEAASRFDPSRGCKFITFAVWYIRQAILKAVEDSGLVHLPANKHANGHRLYFESLDVPLDESRGEGQHRLDMVPDGGPPPDLAAEEAESVRFVLSQLGRLGEDDRAILDWFFGLSGPEHTLEEIGQKLHVSRERVRQLKERAIARLWMGSIQVK